jgi:hypothetical protein
MADTDQPDKDQDDACLGQECICAFTPSGPRRPQPKCSPPRLNFMPEPMCLSHAACQLRRANQKEI